MPKPRNFSFFRRNLLNILTVIGVLAGVGLGFILKEAKENWSKREISYVKFVGELFLNILKGLILPLVVSSLVAAVGTLDLSLSRKIGGRGLLFFAFTTLFAIILGMVLALAVQPGINSERGKEGQSKADSANVQDTLMDLVRNMFPPNLIQASLSHYRTKLTLPDGEPQNSTLPLDKYVMSGGWESGTNYMGLIIFSIALGITLASMGPTGKPLLTVFQSMADAMMILISRVIWLSPIGVMFLIGGEIICNEDFGGVIKSLGLYLATIMAGLTIHGVFVLPGLYFLMTRKLPFKFFANMMPAMVMAFGSGSSTATLPYSMKCMEEANRVDPRVSRFLLPIGATVNMDGTALFQAVAAIFIAQLVGLRLNVGTVIAIGVMSLAASISAAGIPHGGFVTMVMLLNTIGLPAEYLAYILPIDWLVDRLRTPINVLGDCFVAGIIHHMCKEELQKLPPQPSHDNEHLLAEEHSSGNGHV